MAHVNDVTINYGSTGDGRAYADIQFSVNFDQQELGQNTPFGMYLGLFAPESAYANYANAWGQPSGMSANRAPYGAGQQHFASSLFGMNQPNNLVWSSRETITPNGYRTLALSRRVTLNQVSDLNQLPQLTAHIWMVPEHYEHRGMPYIGQYLRMNNPALWQSFQRYFPAFYNAYQQPGMLGQNGFGEYYGPAFYQPAFGGQFNTQFNGGQFSGFGGPWAQPFAAQGQHSPNTVGMSGWSNGWGNSYFNGNGQSNSFGPNPWNGAYPSAYAPFGLSNARAFGRSYGSPYGSGFGNGFFGQSFFGQQSVPTGSFAGAVPHANGITEPFAY